MQNENKVPALKGRLLFEKRWNFFCVQDLTPEAQKIFSCAFVDLNYAASFIAHLYDRETKSFTFESYVLIPHIQLSTERSLFPLTTASFKKGRHSAAITPWQNSIRFVQNTAQFKAHFDFSLNATSNQTLAPNNLSFTNKTAGCTTHGALQIQNHTQLEFDSAVAGFDYSQGQYPRHTEWRWTFFHARTQTGQLIALNLCRGNNLYGANENCLWIDGQKMPLDQVVFDEADTHITIHSHQLNLRFEKLNQHAEKKNLVILRSQFVQWVGSYTGTIQFNDINLTLLPSLGLCENQDIVW